VDLRTPGQPHWGGQGWVGPAVGEGGVSGLAARIWSGPRPVVEAEGVGSTPRRCPCRTGGNPSRTTGITLSA
jgi:hypothetical protein